MKQTGVYLHSSKRCHMSLPRLCEKWQNRNRKNKVYWAGFLGFQMQSLAMQRRINTSSCSTQRMLILSPAAALLFDGCQRESAVLLAAVVSGWGAAPRPLMGLVVCTWGACRLLLLTEELTVELKSAEKKKKKKQQVSRSFVHSSSLIPSSCSLSVTLVLVGLLTAANVSISTVSRSDSENKPE